MLKSMMPRLQHTPGVVCTLLILLLINIGAANEAEAGGIGVHRWQHYDALVRQISNRYKIDYRLIHAVIAQESAYNRFAVSWAGAQGLMQLMPATARELRVSNSFSEAQNIDGGTRYLIEQLHRFGSVKRALQAYNCGPDRVSRGRVPRISIRYANEVIARFNHNKRFMPRSDKHPKRSHTLIARNVP